MQELVAPNILSTIKFNKCQLDFVYEENEVETDDMDNLNEENEDPLCYIPSFKILDAETS